MLQIYKCEIIQTIKLHTVRGEGQWSFPGMNCHGLSFSLQVLILPLIPQPDWQPESYLSGWCDALWWLYQHPAPFGQLVALFIFSETGSLGLVVADVSGYSQGRCREHWCHLCGLQKVNTDDL